MYFSFDFLVPSRIKVGYLQVAVDPYVVPPIRAVGLSLKNNPSKTQIIAIGSRSLLAGVNLSNYPVTTGEFVVL